MYSIVIPTFNSARFIANTVNEIYTIASKELLVFEIIIINDFSKDNTEDILKKLENKLNDLKND